MASQNAKAVAKEVLETMGKGKKVSVSKIASKHGYAKSSAKNPQQITRTKTYKDAVDPVVKAMIRERDRAIKLMEKKITGAKYRDLTDSIDKLTKNIQLLSGKETTKEAVIFTWE